MVLVVLLSVREGKVGGTLSNRWREGMGGRKAEMMRMRHKWTDVRMKVFVVVGG